VSYFYVSKFSFLILVHKYFIPLKRSLYFTFISFLGSTANFRKATIISVISFLQPNRVSMRLSACVSAVQYGWIFVKFCIGDSYKNLPTKTKFS